MEEKRTCPICGDQLSGRIDKKFCSDQCRTEYNNKHNQYSNNYIRQVNRILRKNRRIMEEFNPLGKTKIPKRKLIDKGFDFKYFTSIYRTKTGNTYYFCYEQGYLPLENDFCALVKNEK
jgi:predicted nucleic acid-binding Zn ribbon protein